MTKYLLPTFGVALLWGVAFLAQAQAGETSCCGAAGCEAACGNGGCQGCSDCCPRCGCKLVPVCQMGCAPKKETIHEYCCKCKDICIPGVTRVGDCRPCSDKCGSGCNACEACDKGCKACEACDKGCNNGCGDCDDCRCRVRQIHKLVVCPVTKEHSVRTCTVQWTCPNCGGCCGGCESGSPANVAPAAPGSTAPAPAPAPSSNKLPPAPKMTDVLPLPGGLQTVQVGF